MMITAQGDSLEKIYSKYRFASHFDVHAASRPTDIPVYFFGLYLFLSQNGLIHCLQFFVPKLFLKMPICIDINRNMNIMFDCLFFMFCKQSLMPEFLLSVDSCKNWHFQKQFGYKNM